MQVHTVDKYKLAEGEMIMPKSTQTRPVVVGMITSIRDIPTSFFLLNSVGYVYGLTCNVSSRSC